MCSGPILVSLCMCMCLRPSLNVVGESRGFCKHMVVITLPACQNSSVCPAHCCPSDSSSHQIYGIHLRKTSQMVQSKSRTLYFAPYIVGNEAVRGFGFATSSLGFILHCLLQHFRRIRNDVHVVMPLPQVLLCTSVLKITSRHFHSSI